MTNIRIYTSESARHGGRPLAEAVVGYLHGLRIAARCSVFRGRSGLYETGEVVSDTLTDLSFNLPVLIDILVPAPEAEEILSVLKPMVREGFLGVLPVTVVAAGPGEGRLPARILVRDLMSAPPVQAHLDFTVRNAVELLLDRGLKALPVVDGDGVPVGLVTTADLLAAGLPVRTGLFPALGSAAREAFLAKAAQIPVTRVMSRDPVVVSETSRASQAVRLMVAGKRKRLPVVDAWGRLVGMIARIDLLRAASAEPPGAGAGGLPGPGRSVLDLADRKAVPVLQTVRLTEALDALVRQGEAQVAVVDGAGRLVGLAGDRELLAVLDPGRPGIRLLRLLRLGKNEPPVSQVMNRSPVSVPATAAADEALKLMAGRGLKRLPVVDADGRFVAMVRREAVLASLSHEI